MKLSEYLYQKRRGESRYNRKTLIEVAGLSGLSKSYLSKIEAGLLDNHQISLDTLIKLSKAFGDNPIEVFDSLLTPKT